MPNLPFPYDFESGRRLRAISGEFLEKTVFTFLGPSGAQILGFLGKFIASTAYH